MRKTTKAKVEKDNKTEVEQKTNKDEIKAGEAEKVEKSDNPLDPNTGEYIGGN